MPTRPTPPYTTPADDPQNLGQWLGVLWVTAMQSAAHAATLLTASIEAFLRRLRSMRWPVWAPWRTQTPKNEVILPMISEAALQPLEEQLSRIYDTEYLSQDQVLPRLFTVSATSQDAVASTRSALQTLAANALSSLCCTDSNVSDSIDVAFAKFILCLTDHAEISHVDISAWQVPTTHHACLQQRVAQLLGSCPTITRISLPPNIAVDTAIQDTIAAHRQQYVAQHLVLAKPQSYSHVDTRQTRILCCQRAQEALSAYHHHTEVLIAVVEQDAAIQSSTWWSELKGRVSARAKSLQAQLRKLYVPLASSLPAQPDPPNVAPAPTTLSLFSAPTAQWLQDFSASASGFCQSLLPQRPELEKFCEFVDDSSQDKTERKRTKLKQCTKEVRRIIELWEAWRAIESNWFFSTEYKNQQREEIFSRILYHGLLPDLKEFNRLSRLANDAAAPTNIESDTIVIQTTQQPEHIAVYWWDGERVSEGSLDTRDYVNGFAATLPAPGESSKNRNLLNVFTLKNSCVQKGKTPLQQKYMFVHSDHSITALDSATVYGVEAKATKDLYTKAFGVLQDESFTIWANQPTANYSATRRKKIDDCDLAKEIQQSNKVQQEVKKGVAQFARNVEAFCKSEAERRAGLINSSSNTSDNSRNASSEDALLAKSLLSGANLSGSISRADSGEGVPLQTMVPTAGHAHVVSSQHYGAADKMDPVVMPLTVTAQNGASSL